MPYTRFDNNSMSMICSFILITNLGLSKYVIILLITCKDNFMLLYTNKRFLLLPFKR